MLYMFLADRQIIIGSEISPAIFFSFGNWKLFLSGVGKVWPLLSGIYFKPCNILRYVIAAGGFLTNNFSWAAIVNTNKMFAVSLLFNSLENACDQSIARPWNCDKYYIPGLK